MINYIVINNIAFSYDNEKEEIKILGKNKDTKIAYVYRDALYYDLIMVYNEEEKWYRNIPLPIFVKAFAPYCNNTILKEKMSRMNDYDDEEDFWYLGMSYGDIPFTETLMNENKIDREDHTYTCSDITEGTREEMSKHFVPAMKAVHFSFNIVDEKENIEDYVHCMARVMKGQVGLYDDGTVCGYQWLPTNNDIADGLDKDDYCWENYQQPEWGKYGTVEFSSEPYYYEMNYFGEHKIPNIQKYLEELLDYMNPTLNVEDKVSIAEDYKGREDLAKHVYIVDEIDREKLENYKCRDIPTVSKLVEWTQKDYDNAVKIFNQCKKGYEEYTISNPQKGKTNHIIVSQLLALADNGEDLENYRDIFVNMISEENKDKCKLVTYLALFTEYDTKTLTTVREFIENMIREKEEKIEKDLTEDLTSLCNMSRI